jgi:hypothetical protein
MIIFFAFPFVKLIPLSGIQPPVLRIYAYPPGYPVEGQSWTVEVWVSQENWLTWRPVSNATVIMHTSLQGDLIRTTDNEGRAIFMYTLALGSVSFEVNFNNLDCLWTPQQRFVNNAMALFVIGIFGIGTPSFFWETFSVYYKRKNLNPVEKILNRILLTLIVVGWLLCLIWFITWKSGTEWGFGNEIISAFNISILFDPHLFWITVVVLSWSFLIWLKMILSRYRKERGKGSKN